MFYPPSEIDWGLYPAAITCISQWIFSGMFRWLFACSVSVSSALSFIRWICCRDVQVASSNGSSPLRVLVCNTGICEKHIPLKKNSLGKISLQSTKSGAGGQFLLQDRTARARLEGGLFTDTGRSGRLFRFLSLSQPTPSAYRKVRIQP